MITDAFINFAYTVVNFIFGIFPTGGTFPTAFHTAMSTLGGYVHLLDPLVPMATLLTCVTLVFGVEIGVFGFKVFRWLFSYVPLVGGKGV